MKSSFRRPIIIGRKSDSEWRGQRAAMVRNLSFDPEVWPPRPRGVGQAKKSWVDRVFYEGERTYTSLSRGAAWPRRLNFPTRTFFSATSLLCSPYFSKSKIRPHNECYTLLRPEP